MKKYCNIILLILIFPIVLADVAVTRNVDFVTAKNITYETQNDLNVKKDIEVSAGLLKIDDVNSTILGNATLYIISYNSTNIILNATGSNSSFNFSGVQSSLVFKYAGNCYTVHSFTLPLSNYELLYTDSSCGSAPVVPPVVPGGGGGGTSAGAGTIIKQQNVTQNQTVEELISEYYCSDKTFINRVFSNCRIINNGICEDGENFILDRDCNVGWVEIKNTSFMMMMWFLRFMMAVSLVLLFKDSKLFPVAAAVLVMLVIYNGAFMTPDYDKARCTDVNYVLNAGYCMVPSQPIAGWAIAVAIFALIFSFFAGETSSVKKKKKKEEDDWRFNPLYPMLGAMLLFYLIYSGSFIKTSFDTARCTDVNYVLNAGYCIMPSQPILGWVIAVTLIVMVVTYFELEKRATQRRKRKFIQQ